MSHARLLVLAFASLLGACARPTELNRRQASTSGSSVLPSATSSASPARSSASAVGAAAEEPPVGFTSFAEPTTAAVARNDAGVAYLGKGKLKDARRELSAAVALDPSFVLARYNLACAEARDGDFRAAYKDMMAVYDVDFVGMRVHAASDTDLTAFWDSAEGKELSARSPAYEARYQRVIDRGLRSILWQNHAFRRPEDGNYRSHFKPTLLRVGVFDPATQRFVAVAPRTNKPILAFAGNALPYAVLVTGEIRLPLGGDLDPGQSLDTLFTYRFDTTGKPSSTAKLGGIGAYGGNWGLGRAGYVAHFWQSTVAAHGGLTVTHQLGSEPTERVHETPEELSEDRAVHPVRIDAGYNHWGHVVEETNAAFRYKDSTLVSPTGRSVVIPKEVAYYRAVPNVIASPDGKRALLVWRAATLTCDASRNIPGRYKMAVVLMETGQVVALGEGEGAGFGAFGPNGVLYVQRDRRIYEVSEDGKRQDPLPEGVLFVPPLQHAPFCGF